MNELKEKKVQVLDDGFIRLIDYMGADDDIAQAARVSYAKGTKTANDNKGLIRYLMKHQHYSPFAMCQVKFHVRLPIFLHNQWVRHDRQSWNVMSARYSVMPTEKWETKDDWRSPSSTNKQAGTTPVSEPVQDLASALQVASYKKSELIYNELLDAGICREQARSVLPMGQYTEAFVTANLGDWMLFLKARMDAHAQKEIQDYANAVFEILLELFPVSMQAFMDYQFNSTTFSSAELKALQEILLKHINIFKLNATERVTLLMRHGLVSKRERVEFIRKLK